MIQSHDSELINQLNTYPGLWERIFSYFGWPLYGTKLVQEFNECSSSPEKNCQQLKKKLNTRRKATIQAQQARRKKLLEVSQSISTIQQEKQVSTQTTSIIPPIPTASTVSSVSTASTAQPIPTASTVSSVSTTPIVQQKKNQVLNVSSPSDSTASKSSTEPQAVQEKNKQVSKVQSLPILTQDDKHKISQLSLQVKEANIKNILHYLKLKFSVIKDDETLLNSKFIETWLRAYGDNQDFSPLYTYVATLLYNSQKLGRTMGRLFRPDKKGTVIDRYIQRVTKFITQQKTTSSLSPTQLKILRDFKLLYDYLLVVGKQLNEAKRAQEQQRERKERERKERERKERERKERERRKECEQKERLVLTKLSPNEKIPSDVSPDMIRQKLCKIAYDHTTISSEFKSMEDCKTNPTVCSDLVLKKLLHYLKYRKSPKQLLVYGIDISFRFDLNYTDVQTDNLKTLPSIVQNLETVRTDHASQSRIYKGMVYGRSVYVKEFSINDGNITLMTEKEIYRYLRSLQYQTAQPLSSEYRKHFIGMLLCIKVEGVRGIRGSKMYIISEDSGGIYVGDFLGRFTGKVYMELQVKIMMEILYLIYLLQSMGIVHNDIHFGNIIIVKDEKNPTKTFTMYDKSYTITNYPYYLKMYDFDRSCISDQNIMKDTCKYGKNKQKDVFNWFALWWLPKDEYQRTYDHMFMKYWENFLRQLKNKITGYRTLIGLLERNYSRRAGTFWSNFCPKNEDDSCDDFKLDVLNNLETIVNAYNTAFQPILTSS